MNWKPFAFFCFQFITGRLEKFPYSPPNASLKEQHDNKPLPEFANLFLADDEKHFVSLVEAAWLEKAQEWVG